MFENDLCPILDGNKSKEEFPKEPYIDFKQITQSRVNDAMTAEILRNPDFVEKYGNPHDRDEDDWNDLTTSPLDAEDQAQVNVFGQMQDILNAYPNQEIVKEKLFRFMSSLSKRETKYAIEFIKLKIDETIEGIKKEILTGNFNPDDENYYNFLATLRTNITLKYPLNSLILKSIIEGLFKMYIELKTSNITSQISLHALHKHIELFVSGIAGLNSTLPDNLLDDLKQLCDYTEKDELIQRPLSKSGEHSPVTFTSIPSPDAFPDIEPYKSQAVDIIEDIRDIVCESLERISSFSKYFDIKAELNIAEIKSGKSESKEKIFLSICSSEKRKVEKSFEKINLLQENLQEIMVKMQKQGQTINRELLPDYIEAVEQYIADIWQKALFPHLLFYAHLIFGEMPTNKPKWF